MEAVMVVHPSEMREEKKDKMRGGEGTVRLLHAVEKENLKNARLMARLTIPADSGIGMHEHTNETEYFFVLKGKGIFLDNGTEKEIGEGDVTVTGGGESHGIRNESPEDLEVIAVIITY
jgi:mannose-6-phosphate isomerase-like protein (cupin superfamily)